MAKRVALSFASIAIMVAATCTFGGPELEFVDNSSIVFTDALGNYSLEVRCTILNVGDTGQVTISVEVDGLGGLWSDSETSEIQADEQRLFTFMFPEVVRQPGGRNEYGFSCTAESG